MPSPGAETCSFVEERKLRLKSAVRSVAPWIFAGLRLLTGALWVFVPPIAGEWSRAAQEMFIGAHTRDSSVDE